MDRAIRNYVLPFIPNGIRPNHLSYARIWGVPFMWGAYLVHPLFGWFVFALLALTDLVDGPLARERNIFEGKRLDEISDKALALGTIGLLFTAGLLPFDYNEPLFGCVALLVFRECVVTTLREKRRGAKAIPSLPLAKLKTFILFPALGLIMMSGAEGSLWKFAGWSGTVLLYVATIAAVISGYQYWRYSRT